ncbi:MAG TPA: hypothetical protein VGG61_11290, partial [Gemmataceae bacterium]
MGIFTKSTCSTCNHRERSKIEAQYLAGAAIVTLASANNLSKSALHRHFQHHVADNSSDESAVAIKQLIDLTQKALFRAQRKGDAKVEMDCLRLLTTLRTQSRIATVAGSAVSASPERPQQEKRDPAWLVDRMKEIYGLRGRHWDARLAQREADARKT